MKGGPEFMACPEDDEFISVFDKMMTEVSNFHNYVK